MKMKEIIVGISILFLLLTPVVFVAAAEPELEIEPVTGFYTGAIIRNVGTSDAYNIKWNISVKGGFLNKIDASKNGVIAMLPADGSIGYAIRLERSPFGFGKISITITAKASNSATFEKGIHAFLLFYYTIALPR